MATFTNLWFVAIATSWICKVYLSFTIISYILNDDTYLLSQIYHYYITKSLQLIIILNVALLHKAILTTVTCLNSGFLTGWKQLYQIAKNTNTCTVGRILHLLETNFSSYTHYLFYSHITLQIPIRSQIYPKSPQICSVHCSAECPIYHIPSTFHHPTSQPLKMYIYPLNNP